MNRTALIILIVVLVVLAFTLLVSNILRSPAENSQQLPNNNNDLSNSNDGITPDNNTDSDIGGVTDNNNRTGDENLTNTQELVEVKIQNYNYSPQTVTVKRGTKVRWVNMDQVAHTVTSDTGTELNSGLLANGVFFEHTFNTVGEFDYHCEPHPQMKGTVVVIE